MADFQGEIAALSAACLWAVASVVYGLLGARIPPLQLNSLKGIVAIAFFAITTLISGELEVIGVLPLSLLIGSGVVGIALGDTAFFSTINTLGVRRALLMQTLTPPVTAILALIFLQEKLNLIACSGILLTIIGVAWVVTERTPEVTLISKAQFHRGILYGTLAAVAGALGAVLSRGAIATTNISPLWAALWRLIGGVSVLLIWMLWKQKFSLHSVFLSAKLGGIKVIGGVIFAAFCGTFLGIWLQQTAIKFTAVGIASTLLQTSPLFVIPIAMIMGEKVSLRAILGVIIAIAGIGVLFYLQ